MDASNLGAVSELRVLPEPGMKVSPGQEELPLMALGRGAALVTRA